MRKTLVWSSTATLLLLAWLGLDDITTGNEPAFWQEWTIVGITVVWLVALALRRLLRA